VRPGDDVTGSEFVIQAAQAGLEPSSLDRDVQIAEAQAKEILIRQICPGGLGLSPVGRSLRNDRLSHKNMGHMALKRVQLFVAEI